MSFSLSLSIPAFHPFTIVLLPLTNDEEKGEPERSALHTEMTHCPGSSHGRLRQRQDIDALIDLVRHLDISSTGIHWYRCSSNNPASLTARLGATIDVEQNHVRFLGDLILNLWDCGGQDAFMDSYLTTQRSTIFQQVGVMIYVFDVETREMNKDLEYYRDCLDGLRQFSPSASVFLLVHKMDLIREPRQPSFEKKRKELQDASGEGTVSVFGTSIYDESLYKVRTVLFFLLYTNFTKQLHQAWSNIVHTLIPNASILSKHLTTFAVACNATEVILFERTTFLVVATSSNVPDVPPTASSLGSDTTGGEDARGLDPTRYERTSELVKAFKYACSRVREEFHSLEMELYDFTAILAEMTRNTYVMVIVHDPTIGLSIVIYLAPTSN